MIDARDAAHAILHKEPHAYSAHPQIAVAANGDWLVVFNKGPRRPFILHPPEEPLFRNVIMRSRDRGARWTTPEVAPNYDWHGTECASLTTLRDCRMMLNQWRFRWYPLGLARRRRTTERLVFPERLLSGWAQSPEHDAAEYRTLPPERMAPWARGGGETFVHFSDDDGESWTGSIRIDTAPYDGGYGMRGACELANGDLLLPLSDIPNWRVVFVVRSRDGGRSWERPVEAARRDGSEFEEPSLIQLPSGRLLMLLRDNGTRHLHQCTSDDDGRNWSPPLRLPIEGYPPHLLLLPDGRVLCTYGWRQPDYGIRTVLSADGGESWDVERTIRIRGGLPNKDLGYPCTILDSDGSLFTVYYGQDGDGVTCIWGTRWRL
jgi:BNR repeat protein